MKKGGDTRKKVQKLDRDLDRILDEASITALRSQARAKILGRKVKEKTDKAITIGDATRKRIDEAGDKVTKQIRQVSPWETAQRATVEKPLMIVIVLFIICGLVVITGLPMMLNNVNGDMEVYLPSNDPAADIVHEVRTEGGSWSVDVLIVYVQTSNALPFDHPDYTLTNVTDVEVLKEMDRIERQINPYRGDEGVNDSVRFVLSLSVIVQEANATPPNFQAALQKVLEDEYPGLGGLVGEFNELEGEYAIPDQSTVNQLVGYIPKEFLNMLVADTNGDGIYDTTGIYIGLDKETNQEKFYGFAQDILAQPRNLTIESTGGGMWLTGPVAMTRSLTERTYEETIKIVPFAVIFVLAALMFFHRNPKIIIIAGVPIGLSIGSTFGVMGLMGLVIAPQTLLIAPVLIALGVAYGLYIANRYSEEKDITDIKERVIYAVKMTNKPILLSAATTAIGFASLMTANMLPVQIIGFGLSIGIVFSYVITMLTVPSLLIFLKYEKTSKIKAWNRVGEFPVNHRKKIILFSVLALIVSIALIPAIEANLDLFEMAPADDPTIDKMREYGEKFGGGQLGMAIVRGNRATDQPYDGSMEDVNVLQMLNSTQSETRFVENTKTITVIDVMKMIRVPQNVTLDFSRVPDPIPIPPWLPSNITIIEEGTSFWDALTTSRYVAGEPNREQLVIRLFYESISPEMRFLLVNEQYSKTLMFVDMPTMDVVNTKRAVEELNQIFAKSGAEMSQLTGAAAIAVAVNDMLLENSFQTLVLSLILVSIVLFIAFRSIKYAAITLIPVALVTAYQPLTLYIFGLDLNLLTGMVGS
ncbi:MAG: MMPL family transporter, partial [Candidatus Thermoplasmatota archaeon]|nr:MMPL family transporter [Candidatus Thermoplasmatota archaeon]